MTTAGNGGALRPTPMPINPPSPWYRRRFARVVSVMMLVTLALVVGIWRPWRTEPLDRISDGSLVFAEYLDEVSQLIYEENLRVTASGRAFVSIAFMLPFRTGPEYPTTATAIRHQLEGAYLAQYWANHDTGEDDQFTSSAPLIKLLLADSGDRGSAWSTMVEQLVNRMDSDHTVAVAGLGSSLSTTQSAVTKLAERGIPMFGAVVTSARLTGTNLARVSPTNADEAMAAIKYLSSTPRWRNATPADPYRAYLVQDTAARDSYAADLAEAYRVRFPENSKHELLDAVGGFDSSKPAAGNVLASLVNTICSVKPDLVFFAGRADELRTFVDTLASQPNSCAAGDRPITVITGDHASHLIHTASLWTGDDINLFFTGLATPKAWHSTATTEETISPNAINRFTSTGSRSYASLFGEGLHDGQAIMAHDAVLTATTAARLARTDESPVPDPGALVNGLHQINEQNAVPGASGWIYFQNSEEPPEWLPFNKAIPIMRLDRDGRVSFVQLSSRNGTPPGPPGEG